ncbi:uncharacterized protein B0I36DRAFT_368162 [Microdochium trichocladiopsis]|uniref:Uncharacterized protein n=1 Tax=Microdochium trichocladiopsis TaxID=1682393 RepID=A0A9P8XX77_9PEZI|nr:uncharacterized protein B0I36DRAFT_368162 [Microdochium trichocladiopsis]KAH7018118.1 hypothetical protein B0I36DRAFT_368162 [Microdochium trichocladiopsis]
MASQPLSFQSSSTSVDHQISQWLFWDYLHNGWLYGPSAYQTGLPAEHEDRHDWTYRNHNSRFRSRPDIPYRHPLLIEDLREGVEAYVSHGQQYKCQRLLDIVDGTIAIMNAFRRDRAWRDRVVAFTRRFEDGSALRVERSLAALADDVLGQWTQVVCKGVLERTFESVGLDADWPDQERLPVPWVWNRAWVEEFFGDVVLWAPEWWKQGTLRRSEMLFRRYPDRPGEVLWDTVQRMWEWQSVLKTSDRILTEEMSRSG